MSKNIVTDFDQNKFKLGSVCKRGHTYKNLKHWNLRYVSGACVQCYKEKHKVNYFENPDKYIEKAKSWRINNPEYRETHKARCRQYKLINNVQKRESDRKWRLANPQLCKGYSSNYYKSIKGKLASRNNCSRRRARQNSNDVKEVDLQLVYDYFNNEFCYCGSKTSLEIEHIKPISLGGSHTLNNLAIACKSCNASKNNKPLLIWYNNSKSFYTVERFIKLSKWLYSKV